MRHYCCSLWIFVLLSLAKVCWPQEMWEYCGNEPADVAFLLDASNSIWGPDFKRQLRFVQDVVSMFQIGENATRVGVVTYNDHVQLEFNLKRFLQKKSLMRAIANIRESHGYSTATDLALRYMRTVLFEEKGGGRPGVAKVGVVITDGKSRNLLRTLIEASRAKRDNVHLFAIGVGHEVNHRELTRMASSPESEYAFQVAGYSALDSLKKILAIKTCQITRPPMPETTTTRSTTTTTTETMTTTTELPTTTALPETTTTPLPTTTTTETIVTTTTTEPTTTTTTPEPTTTTTEATSPTTTTPLLTTTTTPMSTTTTWLDVVAKECRAKQMDIVFALDTSDAVTHTDFWQMIRFIRDFARGLDIGQQNTRISVVAYNDQVQNGFDINEHDNLHSLVSQLYKQQKSSGGSSPEEMIRYVRTRSFRRSVSRKEVAQVVIVLTASKATYLHRVKKQATKARTTGITFIVVGVGKNVNEEEMMIISGHDPTQDTPKISPVQVLIPKHANEAVPKFDEEEMLKDEPSWDEFSPLSSTVPPTFNLSSSATPVKRSPIYRLEKFSELETILLDIILQTCAVEPTDNPVSDQPCGTRQEADVMFVVDSANAGKKNTKKVMDFMKAVTGNMTIDTNSIQVGMVAPDPCAPNQQGFSLKEHTDKDDLVNSLNTETTDFADLVRNMRKTGFRHRAGARKGAKRVAVFIVDGELENPLETLQEAQQAREMRGIEIYVISVGTQTPQPEMMMMCDYPTQKHFYHVESYDKLEEMQDTIADVLCDEL